MSTAGLNAPQWQVLDLVTLLPLSSAADLAAIRGVTDSLVQNRLRSLRDLGILESHGLSSSGQRPQRYHLSLETQQELGVEYAGWHQPGLLMQLLERLPALESVYRMVAQIRDLGELIDFQWLSHDAVAGGALDAAVRYEQGWVALMYAGSLRSQTEVNTAVQSIGNPIAELGIGDPNPRPALVAVAAADRWIAHLVERVVSRHQLDDWFRVYCVAEEQWYAEPPPSTGRGWIYQPAYRRRSTMDTWHTRLRRSPWAAECMRDPANLLLLARPGLRGLLGRTECDRLYRRLAPLLRGGGEIAESARLIREPGMDLAGDSASVEEARSVLGRLASALETPVSVGDIATILGKVVEWPGITTPMLRLVLGEGPAGRRAQHACSHLVDIGLLVSWTDAFHSDRGVRRFRAGNDCLNLFARGNRASKGEVETRFRLKRWRSPGQVEEHEYGLLELVEQLMRAGCLVVNGVREYEYMGEAGALAPDAIVYLTGAFFGDGWYRIEFELSATGETRIREKLNGYASPLRRDSWPLLVVCSGDTAERNFWAVGRELNVAEILTTTRDRLRRHGAVGNAECWSLYGQPVTLLATSPRARQEPGSRA